MTRNTLSGRIAVALSAMAFAGAAFAGPNCSTLTVDATLISGCEVSQLVDPLRQHYRPVKRRRQDCK